MIKVSCLIPAYNESGRIGGVLQIAVEHRLIDEIIVVDDASTDGTAETVRQFPSVKLIVKAKNQGKSAAIYDAITASSGEYLLFLDADLHGLTSANLTALIEPVLSGAAMMSISLRGNAPRLWRRLGLDYISGERVFPRALLADRLEAILALPRFGLEVFLNRLIIEHRHRIKIVRWANVASPYKYKKFGLAAGLKAEALMLRDMFKTVPLTEAIGQIVKLRRLRVE